MSQPPAKPAGSSRRAKFDGSLPDAPAPSASTPSSGSAAPRADKGKGRAKATPARPPAPPALQRPPGLGLGVAAAKTVGVVAVAGAGDDHAGNTAEDGICFICADEVTYWAVGECGHRTCHVCSIRLRALFKKKDCTFCKTECPRVVFTTSPDALYSSFLPAATPFSDTKLGLAFETREQMDNSLALLRFNCPSAACDSILLGWGDLKRHAKADHKSSLCDLCTQHKKIFSHEHTLYAPLELSAHMPTEHAQCGFCRTWFYDSDLLYAHCRSSHEECFICVKQGIKHQYHLNYNKLEEHYRTVHFLCPHPTCLEEKFMVFETELDLQAHAVATHGSSLTGDQRARHNARRIETNFTYEEVSQPRRGGAGPSGTRGGRGGAGGRRDEIAPSQATFVTSQPAMQNGRRVVPGQAPPREEPKRGGASSRDEPPHRRNEDDSASSREPSRAATPVQQPPRPASQASSEDVQKHAALMRKVAEAVGTESKVTSFKSIVRGYKGSELSAGDLVDTLWNMLDNEADVAGPIITGLADLFVGEKRSQLLSAWQDLRVEQNQFPSLAPLGPALNGVPTSAHNPHRGTLNNRAQRDPAIWARVERAALSAPAPAAAPRFPALPVVGLTPRSTAPRATPWASSGPGSTPLPAPAPVNARPTPSSVPGRSAGMGGYPVVKKAEFPSLPSSSAEAERRARMKAALARPVGAEPDGSRWGGPTASGSSTRSGSPELEMMPTVGQGGGKKKQKKVLLMSHGIQRG